MANPSHDKGNVAAAVIAWWEENRPLGWAEEDHVAQATVNCETDAEQALARLAAQLVRATPPSPSTAPEELKRLQLNHGLLEVSFEQVKARAQQADARILELEAALASRPAEVGDDPPQWWHELQAAAEALDDAGAPLNAESVRKIAEQYRQGQRDAVAADRARRGDINPEDAFVLYSAADVIDECGKVLVALKVRGIADRVIMPEITKAPR